MFRVPFIHYESILCIQVTKALPRPLLQVMDEILVARDRRDTNPGSNCHYL